MKTEQRIVSLNDEKLKQIEFLLAEMPGKFCMPLIKILEEAARENESKIELETSNESTSKNNEKIPEKKS